MHLWFKASIIIINLKVSFHSLNVYRIEGNLSIVQRIKCDLATLTFILLTLLILFT